MHNRRSSTHWGRLSFDSTDSYRLLSIEALDTESIRINVEQCRRIGLAYPFRGKSFV
ncbi:hypothetical protein SPHV1_2270023 [Novosphingobium sp. KN65.2]|nr:hypothetical protein SPHV1_2270023 [Novosphingobium sp. KN65.2]